MKTLRQYILEHLIINEGGNAIESNPIPAVIAPKIYDEIENIEMAALGSIGKKKDEDTNGDIDIAIKIDSKEELNNIVDTCFSDCEINYNTMKTIRVNFKI